MKFSCFVLFVFLASFVTAQGAGANASILGSADHYSLCQLNDSACIYFEKGDYKRSLRFFQQIGDIADSKNPGNEDKELCINALCKSAYIYTHCYKSNAAAYSCLMRALSMSDDMGTDRNLPLIYNSLGNLFNTYTDPLSSYEWRSKAFEMYLKSFRTAIDLSDYGRVANALLNICSMYSVPYEKKTERSEIPDSSILKSIMIFKHLQLPDTVENVLDASIITDGVRYMINEDYVSAIKALSALPVVLSHKTDSLQKIYMDCQRLDFLSKAYAMNGQKEKSLETLYNLVELAETHNLTDLKAYCSLALSHVFRLKGDTENERIWRLRYFEKNDSLRAMDGSNTIGEIYLQHEIDKRNQNIREAEYRSHTNMVILTCVATVLFILAIFTVILWKRHIRAVVKNRALYEKNLELTKLKKECSEISAATKYASSMLGEEDKAYLSGKIDKLLSDSDVLCSPDFSISSLANMLKTNTTYVSQIINEKYGMNFRALLGSCRVNEAIRRLGDNPEKYAEMTIEALAMEVGFKSRVTFAQTFRKVTGLTPTEFMKINRRKNIRTDDAEI